MLIAFVFSLAFLFSGIYGQVSDLGLLNSFLIVAQLSLAGIILMLLDELLQKGYGVNSGINLFIASNVCQVILWKTFSPVTLKKNETESEFEGAFIAFFHFLFTKSNKLEAL